MLSYMEEFKMRKSNVVELSDYKPEPRHILMPLAWVKQNFVKCQQLKQIAERKKIEALLNATYNHYLDLYLTGVEISKVVDIHPALYKQGYTICSLAYQLSMEALIEVIKEKRVNECYKNLQQHLKEVRGINGKNNRK